MIWVFAGIVIVVVAATAVLLSQQRNRRISLERLHESSGDREQPEDDPPEPPFTTRHHWIPWTVAVLLSLVLFFVVGVPYLFCIAITIIAGLLGMQLDGFLYQRRLARIENQLADAIDLMISSLQAGATLQAAFENSLEDLRNPLRREFEELIGRIRFGDDYQQVMRGFIERVPLETFRLFATSIAVNWEVGGNLSPALSAVGRTIRDRIELSRRIRSLTTQSRVSVVSIMGVTYMIGAVMWRNDPERMVDFLGTTVGQILVAVAMGLQGLGIVWISAISKPRF